jgi:hypothetical protein
MRSGRVLVADSGDGAHFPYAPERVSGNIGTSRLVAKVFREQFLAPIRRFEARFDRYLRNSELP